jgi:uncharacterized protein (UPF0333 family)
MVETIEYSLVVLASLLFAGSGVYLFTGYTQRVGQTDSSAAFSSILSAAYSSLASNSERRVVLFLSNATISCQGGTVVFESGPSRVSAAIPAGCDFSFEGVNGVRTLLLRATSNWLTLEVE